MSRAEIVNVPTNVITGFLGAGKSTAILHLLKQKPAHERWAILVNEFGEVGIDGGILRGGHGDPARTDEKATAAGLPAVARRASTRRSCFSRHANATKEKLRADRDLKERTARGVSATAWP